MRLRICGCDYRVERIADSEAYGSTWGTTITIARGMDDSQELSTLAHEQAHIIQQRIYQAEGDEPIALTEGQCCFVVEEVIRGLLAHGLIEYRPELLEEP